MSDYHTALAYLHKLYGPTLGHEAAEISIALATLEGWAGEDPRLGEHISAVRSHFEALVIGLVKHEREREEL